MTLSIDFAAGSHARYTFDYRLPRVLSDVMLERKNAALERLQEDLQLARLPHIQPLAAEERAYWDDYMPRWRGRSWVDVPFFEAEVIFYRALLDAFGYRDDGEVDPFATQKRAALHAARSAVERLAETLAGELTVEEALRIALDANAADLSLYREIKSGAALLIDDSAKVRWGGRVDLVLDNAGAELIGDLALIDVLLRTRAASEVHVHCKPSPFFVSDVTRADWRETLQVVRDVAPAWRERLGQYEHEQRLHLHTHAEWSRPLCFSELSIDALHASDLLILKGDLNYRRYVEDRYWPHDLPANERSVSSLQPALALRVLKSEVIVGLRAGESEQLTKAKRDWMSSGDYAIMQIFGDRVDDRRAQ